MQWKIVTVGRPALPWARTALEDYLSRLRRLARVEHVTVKEGPLDTVEHSLWKASEGSLRIVLDERGTALRSLDLASWIEKQQILGTKKAALLIGGADGHSATLRQQADVCWSLSSFTLQHEIALVVMAEQLYRAYTILKKEPYHRE
ncbi:MAG: 23S rRNA (pseudouridine(1915)-N(3))-methyltransferase RlmH [Prosthecobacter sp.]|jgi:23S rRNA (pseudouridine1915-N3)-methyltransferase|nr:23S rRNA (pseudouridine(1915)-N(3))-methyltransferase RlmH [Prosthecobacter sp.]